MDASLFRLREEEKQTNCRIHGFALYFKFTFNIESVARNGGRIRENIFVCFEYPFKAMVKETDYPERVAGLRSWYLQKVHMVEGCITVFATSSESACNGIRLSLICQLPHAFGSHKISRGGRILRIFGLISAFCDMSFPVALLVCPV